ncbi:MAG: YcaO-like family protein [Patescibacteria group bacterium]
MTLRSVSRVVTEYRSGNVFEKARAAFAESVEASFGAELVRDATRLSQSDMLPLRPIVRNLQDAGILLGIRQTGHMPDEPHMHAWSAQFAKDEAAGGSSATSDPQALASALAECLERHLWRYDTEHMQGLCWSTEQDMAKKRHLPISSFAGFSRAQRAQRSTAVPHDSAFAWVRGRCLKTNARMYIPAQITSSGKYLQEKREPMLRPRITTGLATGPTREFALLNGALEIIERDAFMIMWLNQLTCPRIALDYLAHKSDELSLLLQRMERYRLRADIIKLPTDAPAHVVCAVIRDDAPGGVPVVLGLGVHARLSEAAAHAIREALRIRKNIRSSWRHLYSVDAIVPHRIKHFERAVYWTDTKRAARLAFLTNGVLEKPVQAMWEHDTKDEHLDRIVGWCTERGYGCASVPLGISPKNPTPWHVEFVVIPELQPLHINERFPCLGGARLTEIPKLFGYTPRETPFAEEPHPFA